MELACHKQLLEQCGRAQFSCDPQYGEPRVPYSIMAYETGLALDYLQIAHDCSRSTPRPNCILSSQSAST